MSGHRPWAALDVETSGVLPEFALQPWRVAQRKAWMTTAAFTMREGDGFKSRGKVYPGPKDLRPILEYCIATGTRVITWNGAFDIAWLIAYRCGDLVDQVMWLDGMNLWKHLDMVPTFAQQSHTYKLKGIDGAVGAFCPEYIGYEDDVDYHTADAEELKRLLAYNKKDNEATLLAVESIWDMLDTKRRACALVEAAALPLVARANFEGMRINRPAVKALHTKLVATSTRLAVELAPHGVTEKVIASPKQLSKLLFETWGLIPVKTTAAGLPSTDKDVLSQLSVDDERADKLRRYRSALGKVNKFISGVVNSCTYNDDRTSRPQARVFGTYTSRMTYSGSIGRKGTKAARTIGFPLHQMPNDPDFRNMVTAPKGYVLVEFDAAGQEFRWMAIKSGDLVMLNLCASGEDPHSFMGASITPGLTYDLLRGWHKTDNPKAKVPRKSGKVANLCLTADTMVLTDRGPVRIVDVTTVDRVWDGVAFVNHDGVVCSGLKPVMSYMGVSATHAHEVMVDGEWQQIQNAARHGRRIQSAMGQGWPGRGRAAVRIVGGLVRRAGAEIGCALRDGAMRLRDRARGGHQLPGGWAFGAVQGVRCPTAAPAGGLSHRDHSGRQAASEACQRHGAAVSQPEGRLVSELRGAWDRVQVRLGQRRRGVYQAASTASDLPAAGHRQAGEQRSLRAWKLALGYAQGEPCQSETALVYDIVNCGPRTRFSANGLIVHNSLQFRTYPKTFRIRARTDYDLILTEAEATQIWRTYQTTYPGVPLYWKSQIQLGKQLGYAETMAGRRVRVSGNWHGDQAWGMESTMINYPIQGTGGDQKYLAMKIIKNVMAQYGAKFAWDLHDGLYWYVPVDKAMKFAVEVRTMLDNLPYRKAWDFDPPIPLTWDCKTGQSWGSLKQVES